ncbi:MAG: hypothetical protein AAF614_22480 [Chloroflexota bacterium]
MAAWLETETAVVEESYTALRFSAWQAVALPFADEPHVAVWRRYIAQAEQVGAYAVLRDKFGCLSFPIRAGIYTQAAYRAVCLQGAIPPKRATGILFERPAAMKLELVGTIAGTLPIIRTPHRPDFIKLVQAFAHRNEPYVVPDSMGACLVSGFNNWDRVRQYQQSWRAKRPFGNWDSEFQKLQSRKECYQDRFLILSEGPYSNVPGQALNLPAAEWQALSYYIRRQHESAHYVMKRVYGVMHKHVLDEIIADYAALVAVTGRYRADWFLHFMGLERERYRENGRLQNYCPSLPPTDFAEICHLTRQATASLNHFDAQFGPARRSQLGQAHMMLAISQLSLAELGSSQAPTLLARALASIESATV